ncbi:MAG: transcriptional regulator [Clostridia bacterium]|nr:transcriptional regulator [Clostridia bacterium]
MSKDNGKKIRLVRILEMLSSDTDVNNPISSTQILERLKAEGMSCTRQTLYKDIGLLVQSGYRIEKVRGVANEYYMEDRTFTVPELRILLDAVQAATFITPAKTSELMYKIYSLGGATAAEKLRKDNVRFNSRKHTNEHIYYNVNEIAEAIESGKKISFRYFDYNEKKEKVYRKHGGLYKESPYATIYADDNYYILTYNEDYMHYTHYRVDKMDNVRVLEEDAVPKGDLDISKYTAGLFGMFAGEKTQVILEADKRLIDTILDRFGEDVQFTVTDDGKVRFRADVQASPRFISWVCSFGKSMKVISPPSVIHQIQDSLSVLEKMYPRVA